jgi:alcohol dehydrogenase
LLPEGSGDEEILMLADILPTGYEVGALNGQVRPGDTVAVVGAGPVGLAAITCAQLYTPGHAVAYMKSVTGGRGADGALEAVGVPASFELCTELVRRLAGTSPMSACTASCTWNRCGSATSP